MAGNGTRDHALDALRGLAMLLGLILHASLHYLDPGLLAEVVPNPTTTPPEASAGLRLMIIWIHIWRMPLFLLLAGYFTALILERRGALAFLRDRAQRILGVLVVFHLVFVALFGRPLGHIDHLWFLYLLVFYCLSAPFMPARLGARLFQRGHNLLWLLPIFFLGGLVGRTTLWHRIPETVWDIHLGGALMYGAFFWAGMLLWHGRAALDGLGKARHWLTLIAAGTVCVFLVDALLADITSTEPLEPGLRVGLQAAIALGAFGWIFGFIGLMRALIRKPYAWSRWLLELAYPVYVLHLYFALGVSGRFVEDGHSQAVTLIGSSLVTFGICVLIYFVAIRHTPLGFLFNGHQKTRLMWPFRQKQKAA